MIIIPIFCISLAVAIAVVTGQSLRITGLREQLACSERCRDETREALSIRNKELYELRAAIATIIGANEMEDKKCDHKWEDFGFPFEDAGKKLKIQRCAVPGCGRTKTVKPLPNPPAPDRYTTK